MFVDSRYRDPNLDQFPLVHFNNNGDYLQYQGACPSAPLALARLICSASCSPTRDPQHRM